MVFPSHTTAPCFGLTVPAGDVTLECGKLLDKAVFMFFFPYLWLHINR